MVNTIKLPYSASTNKNIANVVTISEKIYFKIKNNKNNDSQYIL